MNVAAITRQMCSESSVGIRLKIFHNHDVVNVEAIIIKSLVVIHDFRAVDVVLKCKYLHIFAMIIYVVNVVAVVSKMELKFVFLGMGHSVVSVVVK